jgi:epoxyqueuosine reductase
LTTSTTELTAEAIKLRARELGADLVGIADGGAMGQLTTPPGVELRPSRITDYDGDRVIVLARRLLTGTNRLTRWDERHKYYNDELALTALEQTALDLVLWLEDQGVPALIVPATHVDPWSYRDNPEDHLEPLLSLNYAAVEAGIGTLGLNLQLLTPQYGPRVVLSAVLCSVDVECDSPIDRALCRGPSCGRCLRACPGDVIGHYDRDWPACDRYRSPHGFAQLTDFLNEVLDEPDLARKAELVRSRQSFELWISILRGAGVVTGCRRCAEVCPVGDDYPALQEPQAVIAETSEEKELRLVEMIEAEQRGELPTSYRDNQRWIRSLPSPESNPTTET